MYYAHSANPRGQRQPLSHHLRNVAELTAEFARTFDSADAGRFLGMTHDIGKFNPAFQSYLLQCESPGKRSHGPDHKRAGAALTKRLAGPLAMVVQAHHGGLKTPQGFQAWLAELTQSDESALRRLAEQALPELKVISAVDPPAYAGRDSLSLEFYLRMLFSALVDADFLDTEAHFAGAAAPTRGSTITIGELWCRFEAAQDAISGKSDSVVAQARHAIYEQCLARADDPQGLFRLTVPTGGGKTRSGMAFALRHALRHGLRRIIVAVPFISITEQTVDSYRQIFGSDEAGNQVVLEHHSGAGSREPDAEGYAAHEVWRRLAAENWDAPIVVTTTVQLFESLFADSTSRCRKLHNLARSAIILDEAQAIPATLLTPALDALRRLHQDYHSTIVISTATQPAFDIIPAFKEFRGTEIVPDPGRYFQELTRVSYEWRTDEPMEWADVADALWEHEQLLVVLNTKKDAVALLDALGDPEALHLSTLLCGAHRRAVLKEVRSRLEQRRPCRLVSTQVIEAGVDLDFPVVYRAVGPLDSIIQAAGRCNREGKLERGRVVVFKPAGGGMPKGSYSIGAGVTAGIVGGGHADPNDPELSDLYFRRYLPLVNTDGRAIQKLRESLDYPETAANFRMIDDATESVVVPYGDTARAQALLERLREGSPDARLLMREIQPYTVSLWTREAERCRRSGLVSEVRPGLGEWLGRYDPVKGIVIEGQSPDHFVF